MKINLQHIRKMNKNIKINKNRRTYIMKNLMKYTKKIPIKARGHYALFPLLLMAIALVFSSSAVLAVGNAADVGLTTGVNNLVAILENKLTPVILIAGCLAALVYSLSIAQPKPFLLSLVTLCGFGFAKAWIAGTYALVG
jgi:uncharacterized paraquat-inducible protein A